MEERRWLDFIRNELAPYPQRLSGTLRDTLSITLAVIFVMTLRVPAAAIGIFNIFLLTRQMPSLSLISAARNLLALCAGVGTCLVMIQVTDNDPMARLVGFIVCMTATGFMLAASSIPAEATAFCVFWFSTLAGWDAHSPAERTVETSLWVIAAAALSVGCAVAVEYVFGSKTPVANLNEEMESRLLAVEQLFTLYAEDSDEASLQAVRRKVVLLAHAGQERMQRVYERIVERNLRTVELPPGTRMRIPMLADLMDLVATFALGQRSGVDDSLRNACAEIALLCGQSRKAAPSRDRPYEPSHGENLLGRIWQTLHELSSMQISTPEPGQEQLMTPLPMNKQPIFVADAFSNPQHFYFALKTGAAGTICYVFYNAVGWPGLTTSVITVLVAAVSTTAAMKQKQLFRLLGAVIGGAIGMFAVSFLFPYMDSITALIILVGAVTFAAAWMARSPRTSYVGLQTALAFYLVAFQSFRAPVLMAPARDRVVGVGVGLLVMWFIFDQITPVRTSSAMRLGFARLLRETGQLFVICAAQQPKATRMIQANKFRYSVGLTMFRLRQMHEAVSYEFGSDRQAHMVESERIMQAAIAAAALFWSGLEALTQKISEDPVSAEMRCALGQNLERIAESYEGLQPGPGNTISDVVGSALIADASLRNSMARYLELREILPA
jgi:multidrug resistance protein MdtO